MIVRKSQISQLIKKEKEKERRLCQREYDERIRNIKKQLQDQHARELKENRRHYRSQIKKLETEREQLRKEIDSHYALYQQIRRREKTLDQISAEIEFVLDTMTVRVQESIQPFLRTRSKMESTKRLSDKKHDKVESIFRAVK